MIYIQNYHPVPAKKKKYYPVKKNSCSHLPNINGIPNFNNKIYTYMNTGKNDDRNYIGNVKRTITMKNANNETLVIEEEHNFINGNSNSSLRQYTGDRYKKAK